MFRRLAGLCYVHNEDYVGLRRDLPASAIQRIVVGSHREARAFDANEPYAVISFVGTHRNRLPPRLKPSTTRLARIIVRADDCYDSTAASSALSYAEAERVARFVRHVAPRAHALLVTCYFGEGRSAGAAIAIAAALNLRWDQFTREPFAPNGHIICLIAKAFEALGYSCIPDELAACDLLYSSSRLS